MTSGQAQDLKVPFLKETLEKDDLKPTEWLWKEDEKQERTDYRQEWHWKGETKRDKKRKMTREEEVNGKR